MYSDNSAPGVVPILGTIFIATVAVILIVVIITTIIYTVKQWRYNSSQPILKVVAEVKTRRADVSSSMSGSEGFIQTTDTKYYVTFELESGNRIEFLVTGQEYGLCAEGDKGNLTFQGTRYIGFDRSGYY